MVGLVVKVDCWIESTQTLQVALLSGEDSLKQLVSSITSQLNKLSLHRTSSAYLAWHPLPNSIWGGGQDLGALTQTIITQSCYLARMLILDYCRRGNYCPRWIG